MDIKTIPGPIDLLDQHPRAERISYPTGANIFSKGDSVSSVYAIDQGLVEVDSGLKNCLRYGPGEFFYYKDLLTSDQLHTGNARAITPLSIFSLNSASFFELIHKHPTLVLDLLTRQHVRLREERITSCNGC